MSVYAKTMSRAVSFYMQLYVSFLLYAVIVSNMKYVNSLSDRCLKLVEFDINNIEDHLSKLNFTDVPTLRMMIAGFKCPISALPFGALKSDWTRLLLLQEALPDESIIKNKLVQLIRLLIIAYYQMEERFDIIKSDMQTPRLSLMTETTTVSLDKDATNESHSLNNDHSWTTEANNYQHSYIHSSPIVALTINDDYLKNDTSTKTEVVTVETTSSSDGTTSIVPFDNRSQDVSLLTDFKTVTVPHLEDAPKVIKANAIFKAFGNCLKQPSKEILRKYPPNRTRNKVFERLKNKKYTERDAIQQRNEINGHGKNRTVSKISPPANDFWRYVAFPTGAPLTISTIARPYRTQGLNGFRTKPRKSRKRAGLNTVAYESFRRFYDVDKNKGGSMKCASNKSDITIEHIGKN